MVLLFVVNPLTLVFQHNPAFRFEQRSTAQSIPKIIHFVWIDVDITQDVELPHEMQLNVKMWKKLNPTWKVIVWSPKMVEKAFPQLVNEIRNYRVTSWQSNLIRYRILYEFGGLYLDTDIYPLRSLPKSITREPFAVCQRPLAFEVGKCWEVCNAVIGVPARMPVMFQLLEASLWRSRVFNTLCAWCPYGTFISGPPVLTAFLLDRSDEFEIMPTHTFFPCWFQDRSKCVASNFISDSKVLGMHTWNHSWKENTLTFV